MNTLRATRTSFPPTNTFFYCPRKFSGGKKSTLCFSNSEGAAPDSSSPSSGDKRKQELLAQIAMLQAQKVRLADFLDERSAYLNKFAEDANIEFDEIGENTLKQLEEASSRIMENLENRMQAIKETAEMNRQETAKNEKVSKDFEVQMARDQNEGLFFKNLLEKTPQAKAEANVEAQKLRTVTRKNVGLKIQRNIYLALMSILVLAIGIAVATSPEVEWQKIGALGLIFMGLVAQLIYEQTLSLTTKETDEREGLQKDK